MKQTVNGHFNDDKQQFASCVHVGAYLFDADTVFVALFACGFFGFFCFGFIFYYFIFCGGKTVCGFCIRVRLRSCR